MTVSDRSKFQQDTAQKSSTSKSLLGSTSASEDDVESYPFESKNVSVLLIDNYAPPSEKMTQCNGSAIKDRDAIENFFGNVFKINPKSKTDVKGQASDVRNFVFLLIPKVFISSCLSKDKLFNVIVLWTYISNVGLFKNLVRIFIDNNTVFLHEEDIRCKPILKILSSACPTLAGRWGKVWAGRG